MNIIHYLERTMSFKQVEQFHNTDKECHEPVRTMLFKQVEPWLLTGR
jgi:hypothetical protein